MHKKRNALFDYRLPILFGVVGLALCLLPLHMAMTGLCLLLLAAGGAVCIWLKERNRLPQLRTALGWAMTLCVFLLTAATSWIALSGQALTKPRTDGYAVVMGAHVMDDGSPSQILRERLDAALAFHREHPGIPMILSGGNGGDEPVTEAEAMYAYLASHGADMRGIYMEKEAHTTRENLLFSRRMAEQMGCDGEAVTILTSEFHICRAVFLARRLGMEPGAVGAATRDPFFRMNYELREVFSMVKAWAQTAHGLS